MGTDESEYHSRRFDRFAAEGRTGVEADPFTESAAESAAKKRKWDEEAAVSAGAEGVPKKKSRWDTAEPAAAASAGEDAPEKSEWDDVAGGHGTPGTPSRANKWDTPTPGKRADAFDGTGTPTPSRRRWDAAAETPQVASGSAADDMATPVPGSSGSRWGNETPARQAWDSTPGTVGGNTWEPTPMRADDGASRWDSGAGGAMPTPRKTKWDSVPMSETPAAGGGAAAAAAGVSAATPVGGFGGATPMGFAGATPMGMAMGQTPMAPELAQAMRRDAVTEARNRPYSDAELDEIIPGDGYEIVPQPATYRPVTPARKFDPSQVDQTPQFMAPEQEGGFSSAQRIDVVDLGPDMPSLNGPEDYQLFAALLAPKAADLMTKDEKKEHLLLELLLKVKNGTPQMRKSALKVVTDKARWFGPDKLFDKILPLMMVQSLEDQERHVIVKLIGRVLYKLDDQIRPFVYKILLVIEPMLIDQDYMTRIEGREIISNLAKAAGMSTMIQAMSNDCENADEYVRNVTARALAVVTQALGIPTMLPFLSAVCKAKKSWHARHTGIKVVQQISILMGCGVLPHLKNLVEVVQHGLVDAQQKIRTMTGLSLAALAEAAAPYGEEAFFPVLKPLWHGAHQLRGKPLAAFLKAIGYIIPLMGREQAEFYTAEIIPKLVDEMRSQDEEMKKIVLKVVKQCVATDGVKRDFVKERIIPDFFRNFWVKRMAADRSGSKALVEATVEIANKVGAKEILEKIVEDLMDENEQYRTMVITTIQKVVEELGMVDVHDQLEQKLMEGLFYAFSEQVEEDNQAILNGFAAVVTAMGRRVLPYLPQIGGTVRHRLNQKSPLIRMQAADLIARICPVMKECEEDDMLARLGRVFYESLQEEFPEVLGSILAAIKGIVNVVGMHKMDPPIRDLLPKLVPILKNMHEKVQENCIDLVGRIADRDSESVPQRLWEQVAQELLFLLKAHKKAIRRAAVNTFGYIAKAIGPMDVFNMLLSNLKVQERQQRVCTTVAIAIVAETCEPYTVIPGLLNEYRAPETNIQHGVLKALSFMFEYIGELGQNYCWAVVPLLEDALMDRDLIHRQMACNVVRHMALGVVGQNSEPALQHLLNLVFPNVFETMAHTINSCVEAIEACRVALGPSVIMAYLLQGLFHASRQVREIYWKIYNNVYIGCQDALVPVWPRIKSDSTNNYWISEVDTFI